MARLRSAGFGGRNPVKDKTIVILTAAIVAVVGGGVWVLAPSLQSSQRKLDAKVGESAELARRMLEKFNPEFDAGAEIVGRSGIAAEVSDERIEQIVSTDHREAQAALEAEAARLQEMLRGSVARTRELDAKYAELQPGAELPARVVPTFGTDPGAMTRDLTQAASQREKLLAGNAGRVKQALNDATAAISIQEGEASGADSVAANRLKGAAHFQEANAAARQAALRRDQAAAALFDLSAAARAHATAQSGADAVEASEIDATIEARREAVAAARQQRDAAQANVDTLAAKVADLQRRIDEQTAIASAARARMEMLEAQGLDYSRPSSADEFAAAYSAAAQTYRDAIRMEHALRYGDLANARIDASGDYLTGDFVPAGGAEEITTVRGHDEYASDLAVARKDLEGRIRQLEMAEAKLREAEELRATFADAQERAKTRAGEEAARIAARYQVYVEHATAAREVEDLAIRKYADAAKAFKAAERASSAAVANVPTDLAPEALERSPYSLSQKDGWIAAEAKCAAADAQVWSALVWFERYLQLRRAASVLNEVNSRVPLSDYDGEALAQAAAEAMTEGTNLATDAVKAVETAARGLENHWTVAATAAAADLVLSFFDRPDLRGLAIQNYSEVVKGRENDPLVRPFQQRLEQLRQE